MEQQSLFGNRAGQDMPLATRMRPRTLEEFAGQRHLLGKGKVLRQLIEEDRVSSMIFWGPPGVGKTTLAQIIAARTKANFINFSAVTSGIKEIRGVMSEAEQNHRMGQRTGHRARGRSGQPADQPFQRRRAVYRRNPPL